MSSSAYILIGLLILFISYFLTSWAVLRLHYWVSKEKVSFGSVSLTTASLAGVGVAVSILSMIFASSLSIYLFGTISAITSIILYGILLKYLWKFSNFDATIISISLGIMLNLGWLRFLGIL